MKRLASTLIVACAVGAPLSAQWLNQPTPALPRTADGKPNLSAPAPRAPDGKPDLSGLWNRMSPKYSRNIAADLKPGDVLPWAEALVNERRENLGKGYMNTMCVPFGPSYVTSADTTGAEQMKIIQTPSLIVILNPDLTYRQVFMDGRTLERDPNPAWMGYSVGRWDGDTLVVESNGYNDRTWLDHDGHPHTEALRMTERYRRRDFGHMDVDDHVLRSEGVREAVDRRRSRGTGRRHRDDRVRLRRAGGQPRPRALGRQGVRRAEVGGEGGAGRAREVRRAPTSSSRSIGGSRRGRLSSRCRATRCTATWTDAAPCRSSRSRRRCSQVCTAWVSRSSRTPAACRRRMFVKHVSGDYRFAPKK